MPKWWDNFMLWLDTSLIPVWVVIVVLVAWMLAKLWWDVKAINHDPPPYE